MVLDLRSRRKGRLKESTKNFDRGSNFSPSHLIQWVDVNGETVKVSPNTFGNGV